jgi:hypothetical protein
MLRLDGIAAAMHIFIEGLLLFVALFLDDHFLSDHLEHRLFGRIVLFGGSGSGRRRRGYY